MKTSFKYTNQKQSLTSWFLDKAIRILGIKKQQMEQDPSKFQAYLESQQAISDQPLKAPKVSSPVTESEVDGMQVFTWNDQHDPNQKVLLYIHGGAYVVQAQGFHFAAADKLGQALNAKVVFPNYPLAPRYT